MSYSSSQDSNLKVFIAFRKAKLKPHLLLEHGVSWDDTPGTMFQKKLEEMGWVMGVLGARVGDQEKKGPKRRREGGTM